MSIADESPLNENVSVVLDGSGNGTIRISPGQPGAPGSGVGASRNSGLLWNVAGVAVSAAPLPGKTAPVADAQASCYISYGIQSATPNDFQGQTQTGSTGDTCTVNARLRPGDWITITWASGDAAVRATARIFGTITPPGIQ